MTADEVRGVVFQNATIGGYKKSDVDLFLEEVAVCIESMTAKIRSLEKAKFEAGKDSENSAEIKAPEKEFIAKPIVKEEPKPIIIPTQEEKKEQSVISDYGIQSLLVRAQKLAEQIEAEAKQSAEQLLEKSADDAKDIIARADGQAESTVSRANALLAEAERKEASINAAAREEAENIINEAVARSGRMLTSTREQLKSERILCDKLRTEFNQVKSVIVGFYEEQLTQLNDVSIENVEKTPVDETIADIKEEPKADDEKMEDISSSSTVDPDEINLDLSGADE